MNPTDGFGPQATLSSTECERLREAADSHGTPYFLYDADMVAERVAAIRDSFGDLVSVYFAVKANPNLALLRALGDVVDGLDISSDGELQQALDAGYAADDLSFAGPAKTSAELENAVAAGTGAISLESERELRTAIDVAKRLDTPAKVALRINPSTDFKAFGLKMGGRPLQFGIDEEELAGIAPIFREHAEHLDFRGIHVYAGSQGFDADSLAESYLNTLALADRVENLLDRPVCKINLGGGFGVAHAPSDKVLDPKAVATAAADGFRRFLDSRSTDTQLIFELGRFLVADAGVYVARVVSIKESRGKLFAITDGGLHHHLAAAGSFGVGFRSNFSVANLSRSDAEAVTVSLAGPSCNPTDLLGKDVTLPRPEEGDLIGVLSSGSYGLTASPILFLGRQTPAELVRQNGKVSLARARRNMQDFN